MGQCQDPRQHVFFLQLLEHDTYEEQDGGGDHDDAEDGNDGHDAEQDILSGHDEYQEASVVRQQQQFHRYVEIIKGTDTLEMSPNSHHREVLKFPLNLGKVEILLLTAGSKTFAPPPP